MLRNEPANESEISCYQRTERNARVSSPLPLSLPAFLPLRCVLRIVSPVDRLTQIPFAAVFNVISFRERSSGLKDDPNNVRLNV